jgi:hypothetical protein
VLLMADSAMLTALLILVNMRENISFLSGSVSRSCLDCNAYSMNKKYNEANRQSKDISVQLEHSQKFSLIIAGHE